jgi:signal transduction histidine kinase
MVRRIASLAVPLKLLIFLGGILFATLVLAILGIGSIEHEKSLTEKNYESAKANFKVAVIENSKKETEAMVREILQDSLHPGILSLFKFKDGFLTYPKIDEGKYDDIYLLEKSEALVLKEFLDLQEAEKFAEAKDYALKKVALFIQKPNIAHLSWNDYFLKKMLNDIISVKNLSDEERVEIERISSKTSMLLRDLNTYSEHGDFLPALGNYASYSNEGYFFIKHKEDFFLTISYPELPIKNVIIVKIDSIFYSNKMSDAIEKTAKEWSYIPYSISSEFPFGEWDILIEDNLAIKKESQKKIIFLYLLLAFSLIIPIIGVVVVYIGFSKERQLRLMKDNFLSTVSHELKTPLTSIKMYSEMMNSGRIQKSEKIISHSGVMLKEAKRLENLIEDILNYTRMESGKKVFRREIINISECVNKVCDSLNVIANGKGLVIKRDIADNHIIQGDYPSIYSLVQNLIDNAIKYTAEGYVLVKLQQDEQGISFSVEDSGKGIPIDEQKNIFEGFYRIGDESTRETKGSGLGLAIVKRTADAHKAAILLKSAPGKGSIFTVIFRT